VLLIVFHVCLWFGVLLVLAGMVCLPRREWKAARWCGSAATLVAVMGSKVGGAYSTLPIQDPAQPGVEPDLAERAALVAHWNPVIVGIIFLAVALIIAAWIVPKVIETTPEA
jgi:hypothetical protein